MNSPTGPGISQSEQVGENRFRQAEKLYARKLVQKMKQRNGKMHGGKMMLEPTDVLNVLDLDLHASLHASQLGSHDVSNILNELPSDVNMNLISLDLENLVMPAESHHCPRCSPAKAGELQPQQPLTAFTFSRHPGLIVIPSALPPGLQSSLSLAALQEYPEHPANTNHTAKFGHLPPGLFDAAVRDQVLMPTGFSAVLSESKGEEDNSGEEEEQVVDEVSCRPVKRNTAPAASVLDRNHSCEWGHRLADGRRQQRSTHARELFLKLRWATLGPQFDWTNRLYQETATDGSSSLPDGNNKVPSPIQDGSGSRIRPLPLVLRETAERIASSIRHLWSVYRPDDPETGCESDEVGCKDYEPNAAIVNYYREGDALGGHFDNVEKDMDQPIIGISLGCDGIFLMGGKRRDHEPTALVLRGGDVVVLAGEARRCYHGVPRIVGRFEDLKEGKAIKVDKGSLANEASYLDDPSAGVFGKVEAYIRATRINISIRSV